MGKGVYYTEANIRKLMQEGKLTQAQLDDHVRRILRMTVAMGFMDRAQEDKSIPLDDPSSAAVALKIAREGLVLLRNQNDLLPLSKEKVRNLVVLGPNACPAVTGGGGSSQTDAFTSLSLLDAIKSAAGPNIKVSYIPTWMGANPTSSSGFSSKGFFEPRTEDGQRGAKAEYFSNTELSGSPVVTRNDSTINFRWDSWHPVDQITSPTYSIRWNGKIKFDQTDDYEFACWSDGAKVMLDGKVLFDNWSTPGLQSSALTLHMDKDTTHDLRVEYRHLAGNAAMQLTWGKASQHLTADEQKQISAADAVVISVGFNPWLEGEGSDRTYDLPPDQGELIRTITHLNPHNIVVLNAGGNVAMSRWIDRVGALFHAWYPGQNGNTAVAEAIFGDLNPSGKLPDSFEEKFEDSPAYGNYPGDPANGGTVKYAEGIYVGYRWFDKKNISPRFPFGYGLSYTTFSMDNMNIDSADAKHKVSVNVTNTGSRKGTSVVELYVRPIDSKIDRPVQELKGFQRVELDPGQSKTATFELNADSFATYDEKKHAWIYPDGAYEIAIGSSSRDIHCTRTLSWHSK
jgi:beta-glucosidase